MCSRVEHQDPRGLVLHKVPESEELMRKRVVLCPDSDRLLETLERGFIDPDKYWNEGRIEIRYYWDRGARGAAWSHLTRNPPVIEVDRGEGEVEYFRPVVGDRYNPYRKNHGARHWAWYVLRWEAVPHDELGDKSSDEH